MDAFVIVLVVLAALCLFGWIAVKPRKKPARETPLPGSYRQLLDEHVAFYRRLDDAGKKNFENRVQHFLDTVVITGAAGIVVEDIDRVFIGASAIIPIYAFPDWEYINLREVLLYPETFNEEFEIKGNDRSIMGMVGNGPMQQLMILSQHALREGFSNKTDKRNTAIHEFVHLVDKTDGAVDGLPEVLLQHQYALPWLDLVHKNIQAIKANQSDIDPYGATSQAEFFAVVSEYFFERPDLLQTRHPGLFEMLQKIFAKQ